MKRMESIQLMAYRPAQSNNLTAQDFTVDFDPALVILDGFLSW